METKSHKTQKLFLTVKAAASRTALLLLVLMLAGPYWDFFFFEWDGRTSAECMYTGSL